MEGKFRNLKKFCCLGIKRHRLPRLYNRRHVAEELSAPWRSSRRLADKGPLGALTSALCSLESPASLWAWRVLLRLSFQGTSFRLSDTRTQGRGAPKEAPRNLPRSSFQGLALSLALFTSPTFPCTPSPPHTLIQGQHSVPTCCALALVLWLGPSFQHLCGWKGRIGQSGYTQPHRPAPGWHRSELVQPEEPSSGRSIRGCGYGPARAEATQWAPLFLPGAARPSGPRALPQWAAPTPAPCAKAPRRPLPCAPAG